MSEWQPIDTAPKDGTKILAYTHDGLNGPEYAVLSWYIHEGYVFKEMEGGLYMKVLSNSEWWDGAPYTPFPATHWQPLPTPPDREG